MDRELLESTYTEPGDDVRIGRVTGATDVLLVTSRSNFNGVFHSAFTARIEGSHVENIDAFHLSQYF